MKDTSNSPAPNTILPNKIPENYLQQAYTIINVTLFLPVLIWPMPILISGNPMLIDAITPTWMLFIALFLIAASAMDSMLYKPINFNQAITASLWVAMFTLISIATLQQQESAWLFGVLFIIHSFRATFKLFKTDKHESSWWLWLAWVRDTTSAIVILFWSALLATV